MFNLVGEKIEEDPYFEAVICLETKWHQKSRLSLGFLTLFHPNKGWQQTDVIFTVLTSDSYTCNQSKFIYKQDFVILWLVVRTLVEEGHSYWEFRKTLTCPTSWQMSSLVGFKRICLYTYYIQPYKEVTMRITNVKNLTKHIDAVSTIL